MFGFRFSKINYKKYKQTLEPQEIFLDKLAQEREKEFSSLEGKLEVPVSKKALKVFLFFIILIIFVLFLRTSYFQILKNEEYLALANENKFIIYSIRSDRGVIYDKDGKQLVFNKPTFDLILNKSELPEDDFEKEEILKQIAQIIKQDYDLLKNGIDQLEGTILISENLDHQTLIILETKVDNLPGFYVIHNSVRYYQDGQIFSHLIGYTGKVADQEYIGKDGLEKSYQDVLEKIPGKIKFERDVYGNLLSKEIVSLPESGRSLVLWLKSGLQENIKKVLEETLERTGAKKAVGIALDPKTGGVLALVSIPSYDNNLFIKGADQEALSQLLADSEEPLFNRAVSGLYSTGSTIKPLIAAAALEEEIISGQKKLNCQGEISIPHRYDPEITYYHRDWRIHGPTDIEKAIAESCNVYFYTIGGGYENQEGLGPSRIKQYTELFGWGSKTGIDLPAEAEGLIPYPDWKKEVKKENWWDGDTYNLSIGQGDISVTPLQVAVSFVAIANRGTLFKPQVVKQIVDDNKNVIEEIKPKIIRKDFINLENIEIVRQGMRKAVTGEGSPYASSVLLNSLPISVAAKTGTAQTPIEEHYHNWISVFAPYDDPEIVLTIMIEDIEGVQAAALPAAKQILEYYFSY
jgi:penicillin-binding protein 2